VKTDVDPSIKTEMLNGKRVRIGEGRIRDVQKERVDGEREERERVGRAKEERDLEDLYEATDDGDEDEDAIRVAPPLEEELERRQREDMSRSQTN